MCARVRGCVLRSCVHRHRGGRKQQPERSRPGRPEDGCGRLQPLLRPARQSIAVRGPERHHHEQHHVHDELRGICRRTRQVRCAQQHTRTGHLFHLVVHGPGPAGHEEPHAQHGLQRHWRPGEHPEGSHPFQLVSFIGRGSDSLTASSGPRLFSLIAFYNGYACSSSNLLLNME
jgi:hypothetical protein